METARINGQEFHSWFGCVLERLPTINCVEYYEALLLWNCSLMAAC
ncbi:transposase domain-containing protein [Pseudomonas citronellolis]